MIVKSTLKLIEKTWLLVKNIENSRREIVGNWILKLVLGSSMYSAILLTGVSHAQTALSPTLVLYRSESDFHSAVPIESTERFDTFVTDQELAAIASPDSTLTGTTTLQTTVDQIVYSVDTSCAGNALGPCVPWTVVADVEGNPPVSTPNMLFADGFDLERVQALSFGPGRVAEGIGFYFVGTNDVPLSLHNSWFFGIEEADGEFAHFELEFDTVTPIYVGFHSNQGIRGIVISDNAGVGGVLPGVPTQWAFDDVSRTALTFGGRVYEVEIPPEDTRIEEPDRILNFGSFDEGWSLDGGSISTDGSLGIVDDGNIDDVFLDWSVSFTSPLGTYTLTPDNSEFSFDFDLGRVNVDKFQIDRVGGGSSLRLSSPTGQEVSWRGISVATLNGFFNSSVALSDGSLGSAQSIAGDCIDDSGGACFDLPIASLVPEPDASFLVLTGIALLLGAWRRRSL